MSQENVEVVRKAYEAFARGDLTAVLGQLDPAVVSYTASPLPDPVEHRGHDGFLRWVENWTGAFDEFVIEVEDHIAAGEKVVIRALQRATGATSGVPVEQTFWLLHFLREGKIVRIGIHGTEDQALKAAGLRE
jgi:ketosteroid isomerase-like protein